MIIDFYVYMFSSVGCDSLENLSKRRIVVGEDVHPRH